MPQFCDLNRQFLHFQDEESWEVQYHTFLTENFLGCEDWPKLLKNKRVVILAEAGAGKTAEMREKAKSLAGDGTPAFYLTVNDVASTIFRDSLYHPEDEARFDEWQEADTEGVFFLDSVDEARLSGRSLRMALSRMAKALNGNLERATILLSCRVSDWRAEEDRASFIEFLGKPKAALPKTEIDFPGGDDELLFRPLLYRNHSDDNDSNADEVDPSYEPHIVSLAPLTTKQAIQLAEFDGVSNADDFISAVRSAESENVVNRPQDLLSLTSLWKSRGVIGSKYEVLRWSIQQRLRESNLDRSTVDDLGADCTKSGAQLIAAAMTLCRKRFIAWPLDTSSGVLDQQSLNPQDVLLALTGRQQQALLSRAVFDPATHGRVRFHHRSVQELLCAEWLLYLKGLGCSIRRIWSLLSENSYGSVRLRPSLRAVTAWLGQLDADIGELVMSVAPELLIEDGDPAILTISRREYLLDHFASMYRGRNDAGIRLDINQVLRLAHPDLAPKIRQLWEGAADSGELRELLLRLIWIGKIEACGDISLKAASSRRHLYERALGAMGLRDNGTIAQRRRFADHLVKYAKSYPKRAIAPAIETVYPSSLSIDELEKVICSHPPDNMKAIHYGLSYGLVQIATESNIPKPEELISLLHRLASRRPWIQARMHRVSRRHHSLVPPLVEICARVVREAGSEPVSSTTANAVQFAGGASQYSGVFPISEAAKSLAQALADNIGAKRQQFWLAVEAERESNGNLRGFWCAYGHGDTWRLSDSDLDWLLRDLRDRSLPNDREVALSALLKIWDDRERPKGLLQDLQAAVAGNRGLENKLEEFLTPEKRVEEDWERERNERVEKRKRERLDQEIEVKNSWRELRDRLGKNPGVLCKSPIGSELIDLTVWMVKDNSDYEYSLGDWERLARPFSPAIAKSARAGFIAHWRAYSIDIKRTRASETYWTDAAALIGLAIEFLENPSFVRSCSRREAALATQLALHELNGLPPWIEALWEAQPNAAKSVIVPEIEWEFQQDPESGFIHHITSRLTHLAEPARSIVAEWVLDALERVNPKNAHSLNRGIETIVGSEKDFSSQLAKLVARRFNATRIEERRLVWLGIWFGVEAEQAMDALTKWIARRSEPADRDQLIVRLFGSMFDHGEYCYGTNYRDFERPEILIKFLKIAYSHIRIEDDIEHDGAFTPGARDRAEEARGKLLGTLIRVPGEATCRALLELQDLPAFSASRERLQVLADERATLDAEMEPWKPTQVVEFAENFETPPANLGELLFVVADRLSDLADDLAFGRFSQKAILRQDHLSRAIERPIQMAVANFLWERSDSTYSLERESEHESYDKPDISIQRAGLPHPLPLEIKVADSWSYNELREAISDQLIGKYMRPRSATHGLLVITYHGKKRSWRGRSTHDFDGLVEALQQEADAMVASSKLVKSVIVIGLNLTDQRSA